MIAWVELLQIALGAEYASRPWIGTLATTDEDRRPRARSVVCREIEPDGTLWVTTDLRSDKSAQVAVSGFGEIVFWLPDRREQFRVGGAMARAGQDDPRRSQAWRALSDRSRAMFLWPEPGTPRTEDDEFPEALGPDAPMVSSFGLLLLRPDRAEFLDLKPHPHERRRWAIDDGWSSRELRP